MSWVTNLSPSSCCLINVWTSSFLIGFGTSFHDGAGAASPSSVDSEIASSSNAISDLSSLRLSCSASGSSFASGLSRDATSEMIVSGRVATPPDPARRQEELAGESEVAVESDCRGRLSGTTASMPVAIKSWTKLSMSTCLSHSECSGSSPQTEESGLLGGGEKETNDERESTAAAVKCNSSLSAVRPLRTICFSHEHCTRRLLQKVHRGLNILHWSG